MNQLSHISALIHWTLFAAVALILFGFFGRSGGPRA
jgi:hypothetical protein